MVFRDGGPFLQIWSPIPKKLHILLTFDKFHLPTTETEWALVGAMLGKNMHPNPSEAMSSSMKGGKMELFWIMWASPCLGVVIETMVLIRVKGTMLPTAESGFFRKDLSSYCSLPFKHASGWPNRKNVFKSDDSSFCAASRSNKYWKLGKRKRTFYIRTRSLVFLNRYFFKHQFQVFKVFIDRRERIFFSKAVYLDKRWLSRVYVGCGEPVRGSRGCKEYLRCPFAVCWGSSGVCLGPLVVYCSSVWVGGIMLGAVER